MSSETFESLLRALMWTREVFVQHLRDLTRESKSAQDPEAGLKTEEYRDYLREIILDMGALSDKITLDQEVDNPGTSGQSRRTAGRDGLA